MIHATDPHVTRWLVTEYIPELDAHPGAVISITRETVVVTHEHPVHARQVLRRHMDHVRLLPIGSRGTAADAVHQPAVTIEEAGAEAVRVRRRKGPLALLA